MWVCQDCRHYFASSSAEDLDTQMNTDVKGNPTFARTHCQLCGGQRKPHTVTVTLE